MKSSIKLSLTTALLIVSISSCQEKEYDYTPTQPSIDGYVYSNDVAADNLIAHWSFDEGVTEEKSGVTGTAHNLSFPKGVKGNAYKGGNGAFAGFESTPGIGLANLKSITTAFWINTIPHEDGAECIFMLPRTSDFWGNMFVMVEADSDGDNKMLLKISINGKWVELTGDYQLSGAYDKWTHLAFSYNETTSKFSMYVNGGKVNLPADKTNLENGGVPFGALEFVDASGFIIGGFQQHLSGMSDGWMNTYSGLLDEFRIYNKALSDLEISAIFKLEGKGR